MNYRSRQLQRLYRQRRRRPGYWFQWLLLRYQIGLVRLGWREGFMEEDTQND